MDRQDLSTTRALRSRKSEWLLFLFFLFSLPLINPWVRGDGVGYYAFARAPLIEHSFDFTRDYQNANSGFRARHLDEVGQPLVVYRTATGRLDNHFSVGPAILWTPFLLLAHAGVLLARALGSPVSADGFSSPYRITVALATAGFGFLSLLLAFRIARHYVEERWAALAAFSIWWASSLPVYVYFNPFWSHAHSAFTVALFLWYWHETRAGRSLAQWAVLALIAGLMLNVYYANTTVLAVLALEAIPQYWSAFRRASHNGPEPPRASSLLAAHGLFALLLFVSLLPTFVTRYIVYGNAFESGYIPLRNWLWPSPALFSVLFSSNHGLLAWTPILIFSIVGLFLFSVRCPRIGVPFLAAFVAFYILIACYPDWDGISSYGNRFFVSLTPLFILGLAVFLERSSQLFRSGKAAFTFASLTLGLFILWNLGLMIQWGSHLVPARGPVSFAEVTRNQFFAVPRQISTDLGRYLFNRKALMQQIEQRDLQQLDRE